MDSNDINGGAQSQGGPKGVKQGQLAQNVERSVRSWRHANFKRMFLVPIVFALIFVGLVFVGHDLFAKNECIEGMKTIGELIKAYQEKNGRLPDRKSFEQFDLGRRNLSASKVVYDNNLIPQQGPGDTVLAHTEKLKLRFLRGKHVVLYLDGEVRWVEGEVLDKQLKHREQLYRSQIINDKSI